MTANDDRPQPRVRNRPKPAGDELVDPITMTSPIAGPQSDLSGLSTGERNVAREPEATVQLNVRVNASTNSTISRLGSVTGWTKRRIVEEAIKLLAASKQGS